MVKRSKSPIGRRPWLMALRWVMMGLLAGILAAILAGLCWALWPMSLRSHSVDLYIEPGTSVRGVAQTVADSGVDVWPAGLWLLMRLSGQSRMLRAGSYEITSGTSPWALVSQLIRGDQNLKSITVIEGWTLAQMRRLVDQAEGLRHDTSGLSDEQLMAQLGHPEWAAEGRFFPDTYNYSKGSSDLRLYQRALQSMQRQLAKAWQGRAGGIELTSADQALTLASIIEKETGQGRDRPLISAVFHNRLRLGMPLQTDPTVIYGLGPQFDGNLRRKHLQTDHPWNTYTRHGLPPTPIALPGRAALRAAVVPAHSPALYFVARGDGSSEFSNDLAAHNAAVARYQLRRVTPPGKAQ